MRIFLETDRMTLRAFTEDDVDLLYELNSDPEVMRYLDGKPTPYEEIRDEVLPRYLWFYETYENYGYWAAIEKASDEFMGWFLFRLAPDSQSHYHPEIHREDDVELGYRFRKKFWGKGYATEGSEAIVAKGFLDWQLPRIIAAAMEANTASLRVMEKVGFREMTRYFEDGLQTTIVQCILTREEYLQQNQ